MTEITYVDNISFADANESPIGLLTTSTKAKTALGKRVYIQ